MKKLAAVLAFVLSAFLVTPGLFAPANSADDYTAGVRTSCHISVPAVVRVEQSPRVTVRVRPNAPAPAAGTPAAQRADEPTGKVTIRITRAGTDIFSKTVPYNGEPVTIVGPEVTQRGRYVVHARFQTADGSSFKSCNGNAEFVVRSGTGPDNNPPPDGGENPDGLLPDTGGPNLFWLVLGLALLGSGGGLVVAAKHRPGPLYDV